MIELKKYYMIKNVFCNIQCLLSYKTFKTCKEYVIKRHYNYFHNNMNKFEDKEKDEVFNKNKKFFLDFY